MHTAHTPPLLRSFHRLFVLISVKMQGRFMMVRLGDSPPRIERILSWAKKSCVQVRVESGDLYLERSSPASAGQVQKQIRDILAKAKISAPEQRPYVFLVDAFTADSSQDDLLTSPGRPSQERYMVLTQLPPDFHEKARARLAELIGKIDWPNTPAWVIKLTSKPLVCPSHDSSSAISP